MTKSGSCYGCSNFGKCWLCNYNSVVDLSLCPCSTCLVKVICSITCDNKISFVGKYFDIDVSDLSNIKVLPKDTSTIKDREKMEKWWAKEN